MLNLTLLITQDHNKLNRNFITRLFLFNNEW